MVTSTGICVPARSTSSWMGWSRPRRPASTCCSTATAVNALVTEAVSNRVCSSTGTGQRRDAGPYAPSNMCSAPRRTATTPANSSRSAASSSAVCRASNQIGVSLRAFAWNIDDELGYVLNPRLVETSDEEYQDGDEGCLSVPGLWYPTKRAWYARVVGEDLD